MWWLAQLGLILSSFVVALFGSGLLSYIVGFALPNGQLFAYAGLSWVMAVNVVHSISVRQLRGEAVFQFTFGRLLVATLIVSLLLAMACIPYQFTWTDPRFGSFVFVCYGFPLACFTISDGSLMLRSAPSLVLDVIFLLLTSAFILTLVSPRLEARKTA
jgi:hypothetical protein